MQEEKQELIQELIQEENDIYLDLNEEIKDDGEKLFNDTKVKKKKRKFKILISIFFILLLISASVVGTIYILSEFGYIKNNYKNNQEIKQVSIEQISKSNESTSTVAQIVESVMPSIVSIAVESYKYDYFNQPIAKQVGNGTGFIIKDNENSIYIATNNHVIGNSQKIGVTFMDNSTVSASVIGKEEDEDLALIEVQKSDIQKSTLENIKVAIIGKSSELKIGEDVIAIGNALGYGQSVTKGIVSALNRGQNIADNFLPLIQTDTAINPGNSGGPLVNMQGQVVGINTVKLASNEIEGIGYAIPSDIFVPELENIGKNTNEEKATLGVRGKFVDEKIASAYDMAVGLYIIDIESQSLINAGLKKGDIITKINGEDVINIKNIQRLLRKYNVGDEVELTVYKRSGDITTINVELGGKYEKN